MTLDIFINPFTQVMYWKYPNEPYEAFRDCIILSDKHVFKPIPPEKGKRVSIIFRLTETDKSTYLLTIYGNKKLSNIDKIVFNKSGGICLDHNAEEIDINHLKIGNETWEGAEKKKEDLKPPKEVKMETNPTIELSYTIEGDAIRLYANGTHLVTLKSEDLTEDGRVELDLIKPKKKQPPLFKELVLDILNISEIEIVTRDELVFYFNAKNLGIPVNSYWNDYTGSEYDATEIRNLFLKEGTTNQWYSENITRVVDDDIFMEYRISEVVGIYKINPETKEEKFIKTLKVIDK